MPVMDQVWKVRTSVVEGFNSVWKSLTLANAKALPGKFVAAVVALISAVVNFVATPFVWAWSKVPAGPRPSLFSRVSNFFFGPSKLQQQLDSEKAVLKNLQDKLELEKAKLAELEAARDLEKSKLAELETKLTSELNAAEELKNAVTSDRDALKEELETVKKSLTPAAAEAKKKNSVQSVTSAVTKKLPSFRRNTNTMKG
jgi:hypothetical protein